MEIFAGIGKTRTALMEVPQQKAVKWRIAVS